VQSPGGNDDTRFQRFGFRGRAVPGALPQAGMRWAFGARGHRPEGLCFLLATLQGAGGGWVMLCGRIFFRVLGRRFGSWWGGRGGSSRGGRI